LPMTRSTTPSGKPFPPVTRSPSFRALAAPERDSFGSNRHRVCREGKPLHTFMRWLRNCRRPQTWGRRPDSGCASGNYFCTHAATSELTPFAALAMSAATTSASNHRVRPQSHSNNGRALTRRHDFRLSLLPTNSGTRRHVGGSSSRSSIALSA
jgi:hypothetical protein